MPELPEITALGAFLTEHAADDPIAFVQPAAMGLLATVQPPIGALVGGTITAVGRHGKFLDITVTGGASPEPLHLILHLARAGWLRWSDAMSTAMIKLGGPIALRVRLTSGSGFDVTEAGTKKSVTAWVVADPMTVPGVARLGPDALEITFDEFAALASASAAQLKSFLRDQNLIAGIGNAYSDEILHTAKLSPYQAGKRLTEEETHRLYDAMRSVLTEAIERSVGQEAARLKGEKRTGLRVHARFGQKCPVCGDTIAQVEFADRTFQYCPTCQTGGRTLADRAMSRLLK
ncbi:DNA-formamidopyrimidine glycosylase family protein [Nakamurella deserti]|uniref:DNA-formamidopyrimidine glycosylase family protein n=1 Tax=Nakamurella deserti TaxID=2164074 RepID=UPI000DBE48C7|nr:DNA-formamidopyrimidine glycosylase family protein [Nakamurella deserti]